MSIFKKKPKPVGWVLEEPVYDEAEFYERANKAVATYCTNDTGAYTMRCTTSAEDYGNLGWKNLTEKCPYCGRMRQVASFDTCPGCGAP